MPKKTFRRKQSKHAIHKALLAFDVENDPATGAFICAGVYGYIQDRNHTEKLTERYFDNQENFLMFLDGIKDKEYKEIPCMLVAFNLAYDYWFINSICDDGKLLSANGRIITGKLNNGLSLMDLTNHVDGSLEDWIGYLNMKEKFGIKKESLDDLKIRVMSDARATYELAHFLEDFYVYEMGISFKLTVASCARELFAQKFFSHYWKRDNESLDNYERESYRGGRVEVYKRGEIKINGFDVNSMYLSVMRDCIIPDPNTGRMFNTPKELPKGLYIAKVTVKVPKQHIPPLPYMDEKLLFPIGTFTGVYCSPELNYAVDECGVQIKKIEWVITYKGGAYFEEYAKFIWQKRQEYKAKGNVGMDKMIKKLGNALYGSFGQKNDLDSFYGKLSDYGVIEEGRSITPTTIGNVDYVSISGTIKEDSSHTFPCIPSFITSYARLKLLKGLKANEDFVVYCDTDSIKVEGEAKGIVIGNGLGEWGTEQKNEYIDFYRPKVYGDKIKGVPKRAELVEENELTRIYEYNKPNKMRESFRRGLIPNKWVKTIKVISLVDDKRKWKGRESAPCGINR